MSGGAFNYQQDSLFWLAHEVESRMKPPSDYSEETLEKFSLTVKRLRQVTEMVQRIDWLVSGDDDEESFHERWEQTVVPLDRMIHEERLQKALAALDDPDWSK